MARRMVIMLAIVGLLFVGIFGFKIFNANMMKKYMSFQAPPSTVTAMKAEYQTWQPQLTAVGSLRAVRGVEVTSEISGLVRAIHIKPDQEVKEGQMLVQLNADADIAQLQALEAAAELAQTAYDRDKKQLEIQAVSQAAVDADAADLRFTDSSVRDPSGASPNHAASYRKKVRAHWQVQDPRDGHRFS